MGGWGEYAPAGVAGALIVGAGTVGRPCLALLAVAIGLELLVLNPAYKGLVSWAGHASGRPEAPGVNGMPSGHVAAAAAASVGAFAAGVPQVGLGLGAYAVWTGFQRVAARKHTPRQVLAGALQGALDAVLALLLATLLF